MYALIIGGCGVGKSTLIQRVLQELDMPVFGYETRKETHLKDPVHGSPVYIYEAGKVHRQTEDNLVGFCQIQRMESKIDGFDRFAHKLAGPVPEGHIVKMDEIGFHEAKSEAFSSSVLALLDTEVPGIVAVKDREHPFLEKIRTHPNARCFSITPENRDALYPEVLKFMREQIGEWHGKKNTDHKRFPENQW